VSAAPGRPKPASAPSGGSEPRAAGSVGATCAAPGRPKPASAPSGGSEPRAAGSLGATYTAPGRRLLSSLAQGLWACAALLLLNALLTLVNPGPTPWPRLTPRIAPELCLGLLMASAWIAWRGRLPVRGFALVTAALVAVRALDVTSAALFGRPLHPYWDGRHVGELLAMSATPAWQIAGVALASAIALAGLVALSQACWRAVAMALSHRPARRGAAALGAALLAVFAAQERVAPVAGPMFAGAVTPVVARQAHLLAALWLDRRDGGTASRLTPSPAFDTNLAALHGADVLLLFAESYGVSTLDDPRQSRALAGPRAALAQSIAASGRHVVSARVRSPTYAGGSWLAHGALLAGVDTRDPLDYEVLLSTGRHTLVQHFNAHGWHTVRWMPGLQRPWPEGRFFGFAREVDAANMGYAGLPFGPWRIPDQAAMALLHAQELAAPTASRPPRFIVFPTVNSHIPFRPLAPFVADWEALAGPAPYTAEQRAHALDEPASLRDPVPGYVESIASTWHWLGDYLARRAPTQLLTIVIGDHQPFAGVSGAGASWDVPVHLISADAALLRRFEAQGFVPGLAPAGPAIGGMHALTSVLLRAFDGR
jgi:hypothetical protein